MIRPTVVGLSTLEYALVPHMQKDISNQYRNLLQNLCLMIIPTAQVLQKLANTVETNKKTITDPLSY